MNYALNATKTPTENKMQYKIFKKVKDFISQSKTVQSIVKVEKQKTT